MNVVGLIPQQGTILPGTTIQLGRYTVIIEKYIAEGGFAHVYLATLPNPAAGNGYPVVVKRIAVADKERLAIVQKEIEIMVKNEIHFFFYYHSIHWSLITLTHLTFSSLSIFVLMNRMHLMN